MPAPWQACVPAHGRNKDCLCPGGVWLRFTRVSYTAVSSHTHGYAELWGSYTLLGACGLSPGVGEGTPVPAGLGPVPSEGRALHGMLSFSGLDSEDTLFSAPEAGPLWRALGSQTPSQRSPGLRLPELTLVMGLGLGTKSLLASGTQLCVGVGGPLALLAVLCPIPNPRGHAVGHSQISGVHAF